MHERLRERLVEAPDGERTSAASHMAPVQLRLSIGRADDPAVLTNHEFDVLRG